MKTYFFIKIQFFLLIYLLISCNISSSTKTDKEILEESKKKLETHFNQKKTLNALNEREASEAVALPMKDKFLEESQGYLVKGDSGYLILDIDESTRVLILYEDTKKKTFKILKAEKKEFEIEETGDYNGKKFIIFNYDKNLLEQGLKYPSIYFETDSDEFSIAFGRINK